MSNQLLLRRRDMVKVVRPDYLKHIAGEDGCTVTVSHTTNSNYFPYLEYSINKGAWVTVAANDVVNLDAGDVVEWRCPIGLSNISYYYGQTTLDIAFITTGNMLCTGMPTTILVWNGLLTQMCMPLSYKRFSTGFSGVFVANNGLTCNLVLPEGLSILGNTAFLNCTGLNDITLPSSIAMIGLSNATNTSSAFQGCTGLTAVHYQGTIEQWKDIVFQGGENIIGTTPLDYAHNLYIDNTLVTSVSFDTNPKPIVFRGATCITSVTLDDNITEIGAEAFSYCTNLASVELPTHLETIGSGAFYHCAAMPFPVFHEGLVSIGTYAFSGHNRRTGSLVIPNSVTSIGANAFDCFATFGSVTLTLGTGLTTVPGNVFSSRFAGTLRIPSGVTTIEANFMSVNQISRAYIADTVTFIGNNAFKAYGIVDIRIALLHTTVPTTDFSFLVYDSRFYKLYVPYSEDHSILNAYKSAWSNIANYIYELDENGEIPT